MANPRQFARRAVLLFAILGLFALACGIAIPLATRAAEADKGVLAELISRALSTPATRVSIGDIEGALSSDATILNIEISDRDGVWLRLDRARLVWRRLALLSRRLEVDRLEIGTLEISRRPIPAETPVSGEDQPLLPELPVTVEIKEFGLAELRIGEPILGTPARVAMTGSARLGSQVEGLDLRFNARRLDAAGQFLARLGLVPDGSRLQLALNLDEPAGGILARYAGIPGLPPVKLDLNGTGTLDDFVARLTFDGGPGIGANGQATLRRDGPARRLGLDLAAEIAGLLPEAGAPVFAGTTRLVGAATYGDDGAVSVPGISLMAAAARLDVRGRIDPARTADLRITAASLPNSATRTVVSGADIRRLAFDGRITGQVTSPSIAATLTLDDARFPAGRLGRLEATISAAPEATTGNAETSFRLTADARATGVQPTDPRLAQAVGAEMTLALRGRSLGRGAVDLDGLDIRTPTVAARYAGRIGAGELRGRLEASTADLARFGPLARLPLLTGTATLKADLEGTPRANRYNAAIDAKATRLSAGIAPVDGVLGGRLDAAGTVRLTPTGEIGFEELRLSGAYLSARLDGAAAPEMSNVTLAATLPDLKRADPRLSGRAALTAQLTGPRDNPDATFRLAASDATALGRPVPRLVLDAVGRSLARSPDLRLTLDGEMDRKPAVGTLHVVRMADGRTSLDEVDVTIGSVAFRGAATLDTQNLAAGSLSVRAGNLDDLSPLLLTKASGSLDAELDLSVVNGGQDARAKAHAARLALDGLAVDRLDADLTGTDLYRRPSIGGTATLQNATVGGETIPRARFEARPSPGGSDITATAFARGFDLEARSRLVPGERTRIELGQLTATRGRDRIALAGPATLTIIEGGVDIRGLAFSLGAGRVSLEGTAGSRLDLKAEARAVPLSALDIVSPGLGLSGTLEAQARIGGTAAAPTGEYRVRIVRLVAPQTKSLPAIDVTAAGRLDGARATLDATLAAGRVGQIRLGGSVPIRDGALDVTVRGNLDAGAATTGALAAGGRRLTGRVDVDARVAGTFAAPQASGSATLSGGTFTDALQGTQLSNIRARVTAKGEDVVIDEATATARNGGSLSASGRVRLDPAGGFPGQIRLAGQNAELVRNSLATAVANLSLELSGPLARDPRVSGRVEIASLDVTVPERLGASLGPLPGTRHLNPTPTARARLALDAKAKGKKGRAPPPFDATLDIGLSAPGRIVVHGRGLNAELGGNLRLTGTLASPKAVGAFDLRSGRLQVVSSRLDFSRGRLAFSGDLVPELDFLASTSAGGATIDIAITGPASDPAFDFRSSPDLPRDEILSRLLFNSPSGQLTTGQALALAQAAAQFSGDGGNGPFEDLRRSLGLNGLDVGFGSGGGLGVGLNKALNDRASFGVRAGAGAGQTGVGVDVKITDKIKLKGDVGAFGGTTIGIGADWEW